MEHGARLAAPRVKPMTPEQYRQAERLFDAALELDPRARAAFLVQACGADSTIRAEVESLLGAHTKTGPFIDTPPAAAAAGVLAALDFRVRVGQLIGHYQIVRLLGKGGMGEVYLAEDVRLRRRVALKLLPPESTRDDTRVHRFIQEAQTASALNHPNIIVVYEIGEDDGVHFMAGEFVEGQNLRDVLLRTALSFPVIVEITLQTAAALAAAHAAGIVHRDIKPENIMLRPDRVVKVLDFGLAKLSSGRRTQGLTGPGVILGTPPYVAPERVRMMPADARSDLFSLGVVLYEMIVRRAPFDGETWRETANAILASDPPPLASLRPETPPELQAIVSKMLEKNPADRYQSCQELLADLRKLQHKSESRARSVTQSLQRTLIIKLPRAANAMRAENPTYKPAPYFILLAVLLAALAAGAFLWWLFGRLLI
jgi:eukaryotic-like serine/threonine-protein kinase